MKYKYTVNCPRLVRMGSYLALLSLAACQPSAPQTAQQLPLEQALDQRFALHTAAHHDLPELESAELQNIQTALNGTTEQHVQKILAQLPASNQPKTNEAPKDSQSLALVDTTNNAIVKNAALLLGVRNYEEAYKNIHEYAQHFQAQIVSEEEHSSDSLLENTFVLLTPPQNFDALINELREMAMIIRQKRIWQKDLTAQFVDLRTRVATKQEAQTRLKGLLDNTKQADQIIPIQRELDAVTAELEALVRTTQELSKKAVFTTVTVTIYQTLDRKLAHADFSDRFSGGLTKGWVDFKDFLIRATTVWPWVILGFMLFVAVLFAMRSSRRQARQFQLQTLQNQQQWLIQQQKINANNTATTNKPNTNTTNNA